MTLLNTSCAVSDQPEVWQCVRSESDLSFFGSNCATSLAHSSRAARSLATSMKKFMPMAQKNDSRGANVSTSSPAVDAGPDVLDAVGERVGQLEVGRRPGLLDVVAGDRDRVELRHLLRGELEDVADDPHRRLRRVDVGVADHELLEDVVLDGPGELLGLDALLLGRDDVEREHRQHRAVHRHRHAHLVQRDAVEELAHVVDRVDRHAGHADVAGHPRVVAVVAAVRRQVERDRQALLAHREVAAVEGVGLGRGGEAGVLADRPRLVDVHRRVRPAQVRLDAGIGAAGSRRRRGRRRCRAAATSMPSGVSHAAAAGRGRRGGVPRGVSRRGGRGVASRKSGMLIRPLPACRGWCAGRPARRSRRTACPSTPSTSAFPASQMCSAPACPQRLRGRLAPRRRRPCPTSTGRPPWCRRRRSPRPGR